MDEWEFVVDGYSVAVVAAVADAFPKGREERQDKNLAHQRESFVGVQLTPEVVVPV